MMQDLFQVILSVLVALATAGVHLLQEGDAEGAPHGKETVEEFPLYKLSITIPGAFTDLQKCAEETELLEGWWVAKYGSARLKIGLWVLPSERYSIEGPEDVADVFLRHVRQREGGDPAFAFQQRELVSGNFGSSPFGCLAWGAAHAEEDRSEIGTFFYWSGVLPGHGYCVELRAEPPLHSGDLGAIFDFLKEGIAYRGKAQDPKWSEAEAKDRWRACVDEERSDESHEIHRTEHYIVLTSSRRGPAFTSQLEKNYRRIQAVYPFPDVVGRRLMPVFLFSSKEQYDRFLASALGTERGPAPEAKGLARKDWYATWCDDPKDPVHIHGATQQVFRNRLRLRGGGSWFQEGVAGLLSAPKRDLDAAQRIVRDGEHFPLVEFVVANDIFAAGDWRSRGKEREKQAGAIAALLFEFLRESDFAAAGFQDFVRAAGSVPSNDREAIERAVESVYSVGLADLEKQWIEYCRKR